MIGPQWRTWLVLQPSSNSHTRTLRDRYDIHRDIWLTWRRYTTGQFIAIEFTLNIFGVVVSE
jgi:hypothetical protein